MKQNKRVTGKEQYYTPMEVADKCLRMMDTIMVGGVYLEPAGGTGSFIKVLGDREWVSYDIEPKYEGIERTEDFLKEDLSKLRDVVGLDGKPTCVITISNPPFGRANKLCIPFFNKCAEVSRYIGFLVPKSWRKWSVQNRLDRRFHLVLDEELHVDFKYSNIESRSKGKLNTVFQVWERREELREIIRIPDYGFIEKVKDPRIADVSLTVFGRGCGKLKREFDRVPNTTQMFLKVKEDWVYEALDKVDYSRFYKNTAFVEALSIQEINYLLKEYQDV